MDAWTPLPEAVTGLLLPPQAPLAGAAAQQTHSLARVLRCCTSTVPPCSCVRFFTSASPKSKATLRSVQAALFLNKDVEDVRL